LRIYNRYVITVSTFLLLSTVVLTALSVTEIDVFYTTYVLEALVITELFSHFSSRARHSLSRVGIILSAGFMLALAIQIIKIVT